MVAGATVAAAGFAWQSGLDADSTYLTGVLGPAVLISLGGGLLNTPITVLATSGVAEEDAGAASGLLNTTKQVGGAVGLAALVAMVNPVLDGGGATASADGYGLAFLIMAALLVSTALCAMLLPRSLATVAPDASPGRVTGDRRG